MHVGHIAEIRRFPVKSMGGESLHEAVLTAGGIAGDRGWALRDESAREIRGAKRWPVLMQCSAAYRTEPAAGGGVPHADITLPDGTTTATDDPDVHRRLSDLLRTPVTLWPLRPASDLSHYRRGIPGVAAAGFLARWRVGRRLLQTALRGELRKGFSRTAEEPIPDVTPFAGLFEFTSPPGTYFDVAALHVLTTASLEEMARRAPACDWNARRFRPNVLIETAAPLRGLVEAGWCGQELRLGTAGCRCDIGTPRCGMPTYAQPGLAPDPRVLRAIVREADQNLGVYASVTVPGRLRAGDPAAIA